jgi:hypothetical protein
VRRSVPIRTYADWNDPQPGFVEADLVAHSGPSTEGAFVATVVSTDIATGRTECAPPLFREQRLSREVLTVLREAMPFTLRGFDTDNDTVFINATVKDWCDDGGIAFTRSRPYRKNDQAHIERKNGAVVRRMVGNRRLEDPAAASARRARSGAPARRDPHRPASGGRGGGSGTDAGIGRGPAGDVPRGAAAGLARGRPTAQPKPAKPRYRTVPDPLAAVTTEPKAWFDEKPGITGGALLERLQQRHAGAYPDHPIRTVQRRVKVWRQERARALVLDPAPATGASGGLGDAALAEPGAAPRLAEPTAPTAKSVSPATTSETSRVSVEPRNRRHHR